MTDAQAVGQGCIDVGHLASHPVAAFFGGVLDRTDGAGALGQLDQGHAHVVDHGHQHAPQVVDLGLAAQHHGLARIETLADRRHAQHAFDQLGHHRPEMLRGRFQGRLALAHRPVDDGRDQAVLIQLEIGQDLGHLQPVWKLEVPSAQVCSTWPEFSSAVRAKPQASSKVSRSRFGSTLWM